MANWLNVAGLICAVSMLTTYIFLPVKITNRHYLTVGLVVAICLLQVNHSPFFFGVPQLTFTDGFHYPSRRRSTAMPRCHNAQRHVFRQDLRFFWGVSSLRGFRCHCVGYARGLNHHITINRLTPPGFLRSLSIHLQICWQLVPGRKIFWASIVAGWGLPTLFVAITIPLTGTSYRFGNTCHINHQKAISDYWAPLLAFAAISTVLQFVTFGYCIKVYIKSLFNDSCNSTSQVSSGGLPSYASRSGSIKTVTAGQAYRRIKKVIALQWRGTLIVLIIIVNVVFLAVVFVQMDNTVTAAMQNLQKAEPWLLCLVINQGNKNACLNEVKSADLVTNEATVMAVLILLSVRPPKVLMK